MTALIIGIAAVSIISVEILRAYLETKDEQTAKELKKDYGIEVKNNE